MFSGPDVRIFRVRRVSGLRRAGDGVSDHWVLFAPSRRTFPCRPDLHRRPKEAGICKNADDEQYREKTLFIVYIFADSGRLRPAMEVRPAWFDAR